jgi:hypothetical protein
MEGVSPGRPPGCRLPRARASAGPRSAPCGARPPATRRGPARTATRGVGGCRGPLGGMRAYTPRRSRPLARGVAAATYRWRGSSPTRGGPASTRDRAWASVLAIHSSTPCRQPSIIRLTALEPPPPTPNTCCERVGGDGFWGFWEPRGPGSVPWRKREQLAGRVRRLGPSDRRRGARAAAGGDARDRPRPATNPGRPPRQPRGPRDPGPLRPTLIVAWLYDASARTACCREPRSPSAGLLAQVLDACRGLTRPIDDGGRPRAAARAFGASIVELARGELRAWVFSCGVRVN